MAVEITPEPSEEERQAILRALELEREATEEPTPWRRAGLAPSADPDVAPARLRQARRRATA